MPVAEGANGTFWYVEQSWYSSEEIVNRVANTQKHKVSTSDQDTFGSEKNYLISMPVNFLAVVAFVCIAYYISKRIT
jgi:cell division protein FtsL